MQPKRQEKGKDMKLGNTSMKRMLLLLGSSLVILLLVCGPLFSKDPKEFASGKHPEIQKIRPKKPVRIKLKRTAAGKYSWDLTGDDVDEVVKADKRLRTLLNVK